MSFLTTQKLLYFLSVCLMAHLPETRPPSARYNPLINRLRERRSVPVPEESILLRVLVQALVIVGIIATDLAAQTQMSVWAVPLSIAGATWSWYRRRDRNIPAKFLIAIGMLGALFLFFGNLFQQLNDTRLVLAELLILLQVLHSFDLPRRADLGYSMVIGIILLGVAATLSQTLAFAPLLLLFLGIALPALVLDYRSRLGLSSDRPPSRSGTRSRWQPLKALRPLKTVFSAKQFAFLLLVTLGLGLTIFASLPRLPGYQLRTLPVTIPEQMADREFDEDSRSVSNPGYVRQGRGERDGTGEGTGGDSPETGPGAIDPTFYYGFNTQINQNLRGAMTPTVVLRIRSQAEGFWRVLAFDRYTGQGWELSREDSAVIDRPTWSYQFHLPRQPTLARRREVVQTYTVVSELPNIIPALAQPKELYFPTRQVSVDTEGALRSPLGLLEGLTYTVISDVPYRDRTQLREASTEYSQRIRDYYLQIPETVAADIREFTLEILENSERPLDSPYEQALYLAQYLKQNFSVLPELPFFSETDDLASVFLFRYRGGYVDHFSTTLTVMLRSIGIPSRLVVGFGSGEFNPFTGYYIVRNTDAHAMTEVFFPQYGWFAFDPIPGHEVIPPSVEDYQSFTVLRQFWNWVAGWLPTPMRNIITQVLSAIALFLARILGGLWRLLLSGWVGLFTALMLIVALAFLAWLGGTRFLAWRHQRQLAKLPPVERLYQQMLGTLKQQGYPKHPAQTPLEYASVWRDRLSTEVANALDGITQAYIHWRYGGQETNIAQLKEHLRTIHENTQPLRQFRQRQRR